MAMTAASAATSVLPLPTSPCSSRFMGCGACMSFAISPSTRFCAPVGLKGSMALIFSRTRSFSSKAMPGSSARFALLERQSAFEPEELFEDQPELRGRAESIQQPQVRVGRRKVQRRGWRSSGSGSFSPLRSACGKRIVDRLGTIPSTRCISARNTRVVIFAGGFVDRNDAAGVQGGVAFVVVTESDSNFGMHDLQLAGVVVEFDFAEQRELAARAEAVGQIAAVKPLADQLAARGIGEDGFKQSEILAAETGELGAIALRR